MRIIHYQLCLFKCSVSLQLCLFKCNMIKIMVNNCYQILVGNAFVRHLYILLLCVSNQNRTILVCAEVVIIILIIIIMIHFLFVC